MFETSGGSLIFWKAATTGPPISKAMTTVALRLKLIFLISACRKRVIASSNQMEGDDSSRSVRLNRTRLTLRIGTDPPTISGRPLHPPQERTLTRLR